MSDWWDLIDKRAAIREQFPTFRQVRNERPGCRADNARQAHYRAENRASLQAERDILWARSVAENTRRQEKNERRAANAAYNARRKAA